VFPRKHDLSPRLRSLRLRSPPEFRPITSVVFPVDFFLSSVENPKETSCFCAVFVIFIDLHSGRPCPADMGLVRPNHFPFFFFLSFAVYYLHKR